MAKIEKVCLQEIPEQIYVDDKTTNTITVIADISFHSLDIKLEMEYQLYLFVYDVHGSSDIPVLISNWDESKVHRVVSEQQSDDFLCKKRILISSLHQKDNKMTVVKSMTLNLGKITKNTSVYEKKFEVFATLIPAIDRASSRSEVFISKLAF
ncbi:hypothetical protein GCM10022393_01440 [Aquimarina addita]|uniref:Uncharacterized protein n=1 Tax=Aquimarina addita TaxID=870485 RepID=A0ABP7X7X8_9FLAO